MRRQSGPAQFFSLSVHFVSLCGPTLIRLTNITDYAYIDTMATRRPVESPGIQEIRKLLLRCFLLSSAKVTPRHTTSFAPCRCPFAQVYFLSNPANVPPIPGRPKTGKLPDEPKSPSTQYHAKTLSSNIIGAKVAAVSPAMSLKNEPKLLSKRAAGGLRPCDQIRPNQTTFFQQKSNYELY